MSKYCAPVDSCLVGPFVEWLRSQAVQGHFPAINAPNAPALVRQRLCVGLWFSLHGIWDPVPLFADVLREPMAVDGRERGQVWLLPELLCAFVAELTSCAAVDVVPRSVGLLCELVQRGRAYRPRDPTAEICGMCTGRPSPDAWPWPWWIVHRRLTDGTAAPFIELPCSVFAPFTDEPAKAVW